MFEFNEYHLFTRTNQKTNQKRKNQIKREPLAVGMNFLFSVNSLSIHHIAPYAAPTIIHTQFKMSIFTLLILLLPFIIL